MDSAKPTSIGDLPRKCFDGYVTVSPAWLPNMSEQWNSTDWTSLELFEQMYKRVPKENENVECLNKAAAILNMVFGMCSPPTNLTNEEWNFLNESAIVMFYEDNFAGSMTMGVIMRANMHLFKDTK